MEELVIKIINQSDHPVPNYSTKDSAGMDIRANIANSITLLCITNSAKINMY